ncbi:MAG: hypothetical protein HYS09_05295 [Chloroflexi bacterium]|nr:hypothetical protein [Chloroflexota bacterium]
MAAYDSHPSAVGSPEELRQLVKQYRATGLDVIAWFVPKGRKVRQQLTMAKQVLDSGVKGLYADIEPFPGFCYSDCRFLAKKFWERLRAERPNARLGVIYDPRPQHWFASGIRRWISVANAVAPMCYWETYAGQGIWGKPYGCVKQAHSDLWTLAPGRKLQYVPMLQGDTTPWRFIQAVRAAAAVGAKRVSVWRRGVVPLSVWRVINGLTCVGALSDGCLIKERDSAGIFLMYGGAKFRIPGPKTFRNMGFEAKDIHTVPNGFLDRVPLVPRSGTLVQERGVGEVNVIYGRAKLPISGPRVFNQLNLDWRAIRTVTRGSLELIPDIPRNKSWFREVTRVKEWRIVDGMKVYISSPRVRNKLISEGELRPTLYLVPKSSLSRIPTKEE